MPKLLSKAAAIRKHIEKHPKATNAEIVQKLGVDAAAIHRVRYDLRKEAQKEEVAAPAEDLVGEAVAIAKKAKHKITSFQDFGMVRMSLALPMGGCELKLSAGNRMVATVYLNKNGVSFRGPNAKAKPSRTLTWEMFQSLMSSGLIK